MAAASLSEMAAAERAEAKEVMVNAITAIVKEIIMKETSRNLSKNAAEKAAEN